MQTTTRIFSTRRTCWFVFLCQISVALLLLFPESKPPSVIVDMLKRIPREISNMAVLAYLFMISTILPLVLLVDSFRSRDVRYMFFAALLVVMGMVLYVVGLQSC